jgi:hypothetical protein
MRRVTVFLAAFALLGLVLTACQPQTVEVTRVVTETEVVTEQIEVTRVVEGEVCHRAS